MRDLEAADLLSSVLTAGTAMEGRLLARLAVDALPSEERRRVAHAWLTAAVDGVHGDPPTPVSLAARLVGINREWGVGGLGNALDEASKRYGFLPEQGRGLALAALRFADAFSPTGRFGSSQVWRPTP